MHIYILLIYTLTNLKKYSNVQVKENKVYYLFSVSDLSLLPSLIFPSLSSHVFIISSPSFHVFSHLFPIIFPSLSYHVFIILSPSFHLISHLFLIIFPSLSSHVFTSFSSSFLSSLSIHLPISFLSSFPLIIFSYHFLSLTVILQTR